MPKVVRQFVDPVTGRHMSDIDMGNEIISVPSEAAGLPTGPSDMFAPALGASATPPSSIFNAPQPRTSRLTEPVAPPTAPVTRAPEVIEDDTEAAPLKAPPAPATAPGTGMVAERSTETSQTRLTSAMEAERQRAMQAKAAADAQMSAAIDAQAKQSVQEAAAREKYINEQREVEVRRQEDVNARVQEQFSKFQTAADEYADDKIDSSRYWAQASTSDKIAAGIGLLAGAWSYGTGMTDKNYGAEYIQNAIDRDIKVQEANLNNKKAAADMQRTLYSDLRQQGMDQESAAAKTREMAYNALEQKLTGMGVASKSDIAKATLAQQAAEFKQKAATEAMQYNTLVSKAGLRSAPSKTETKPISEETTLKIVDAEMAIEKMQKLEDDMAALNAKGDLGGMTNYLELKAKDMLGIQDDPTANQVWKSWEKVLVEERAKVFGASLTESERKSFEQAAVMYKSRPEILMDAIKKIRTESERRYSKVMDQLGQRGTVMPASGVQLRTNQEADVSSGKVKKAPSFK